MPAPNAPVPPASNPNNSVPEPTQQPDRLTALLDHFHATGALADLPPFPPAFNTPFSESDYDDSDDFDSDDLDSEDPYPLPAPTDLAAPSTPQPNQQSAIPNPQSPQSSIFTQYAPFLTPLDPADRRKHLYDRFKVRAAWHATISPSHAYPWIVQDVAQAGQITLLVGDSAAKKTYSMLHLALHVSLGLPWLGHPTFQTPVLYMEEDHGHLAINHRLTLLNHGLRRHTPPPVYIASNNYWHLPDLGDTHYLEYLIRDLNARLIILDPLISLSPYNLESVPGRLAETVIALREIAAATSAAFIIIHHLNKRGLYRGVSHLKGLVDNMYLIQAAHKDPIIHFHALKLRSSDPRHFAAQFRVQSPGPNPDYVEILPHALPNATHPERIRPLSAPNAILEHLAIYGPASRRQLITALPRYTPAAIHQALHRLANERLLWPDSSIPAVYRLTNTGDAYDNI